MLYFKVINDLVSMLTQVSTHTEWSQQQLVLTCLRQVKSYLTTTEATAFASAFTQSEHPNPVNSIATLIVALEEKETLHRKEEFEKRKREQMAKRAAKQANDSQPREQYLSELSNAINSVVPTASQNDYTGRQYEVSYAQESYVDNDDDDDDDDNGEGEGGYSSSDGEQQTEQTIAYEQTYDSSTAAVHTVEVSSVPVSLFSIKKKSKKVAHGEGTEKKAYNTKADNFLYSGMKNYLPADLPINNPRPGERKIGEKRWPIGVDYICVYCRLITPNIKQIKAHLRTHDHAVCCCKMCRREFPNPEIATSFHICPRSHVCTFCSRTFPGTWKLEKHLRSHTNPNEPRVLKISCEECEELFADMRSAAVHVHTLHGIAMSCDSCLNHLFDESEIANCSPLRIYCNSCALLSGTEPEESVAANYKGIKITDLNKKKERKMSNAPRQSIEVKYLPDDEPINNPDPLNTTRFDKKKEFVCIYCRRILPNLKNYKSHLQSKHKRDDGPICDLCQRQFPNDEAKAYHICREETVCGYCNKILPCFSKLRRHLLSHTQIVADVSCSECNENFDTALKCMKHVKENHKAILKCDSCGKETELEDFSTSCSSNRAYCKTCQKGCGMADDSLDESDANESKNDDTDQEEPKAMSRHDKLGLNPLVKLAVKKVPIDERARGYQRSKPQMIRCEACDVTCKGNYEYQQHCESLKHLSATGGDIEWSACPICHKTFINEIRVKKHIQRNHSHASSLYGAEPTKSRTTTTAPLFTCGICNAQVQSEQAYMNHIKTHLGVKEYLCEVCGARFNTVPGLANHRASVHKRTKSAEQIKKEQLAVNITEMLEKCWYCLKRFAKRKSLLKHMSRIHSEEYNRDKGTKFEEESKKKRELFVKTGVKIGVGGGSSSLSETVTMYPTSSPRKYASASPPTEPTDEIICEEIIGDEDDDDFSQIIVTPHPHDRLSIEDDSNLQVNEEIGTSEVIVEEASAKNDALPVLLLEEGEVVEIPDISTSESSPIPSQAVAASAPQSEDDTASVEPTPRKSTRARKRPQTFSPERETGRSTRPRM